MKKKEIKKLSKDEIVKNIDKFKKDLFNFRFQKINSQVTNPAKINETRKNSHAIYERAAIPNCAAPLQKLLGNRPSPFPP